MLKGGEEAPGRARVWRCEHGACGPHSPHLSRVTEDVDACPTSINPTAASDPAHSSARGPGMSGAGSRRVSIRRRREGMGGAARGFWRARAVQITFWAYLGSAGHRGGCGRCALAKAL